MHTIVTMIDELKLHDEDDIPKALGEAFKDLVKQMKKCQEFCQPSSIRATLANGTADMSYIKNVAIDVVNIKDRLVKANDLEKGLESTISTINLIVQLENRNMCKTVMPEILDRIEHSHATSTGAGFFPITTWLSSGKVDRVQALNLKKENSVKLTWEYNKTTDVTYQVRISNDVEKPISYHKTDEHGALLCEPMLTPGKRYTFNVRAINKGMKPGPWSNDATIYFCTAVPLKPNKPRVSPVGTKEIEVIVRLPSEEECDGDPVTHCLVEFLPLNDRSSDWTVRIFSTQTARNGELTVELNDLQEYCTYQIRVRLRNKTGDSIPSDIRERETHEPDPGIPTRFRCSSYRTANMIKLRWNQPNINNRFVNHYEIEYRTRWSKKFAVAGNTEKLSFRIKSLSQDTKYFFRIRAVNATGRYSVYTDVIDEQTKYSKLSKFALAPVVFAGSTIAAPFLAGPLLGVMAGMIAGMVASEPKDSDSQSEENESNDDKKVSAGAVAAGIGVGVGTGIATTLLAPITALITGGVMVAGLANDWWCEEDSDQSDLDEEELKKEEKKQKKKKAADYRRDGLWLNMPKR